MKTKEDIRVYKLTLSWHPKVFVIPCNLKNDYSIYTIIIHYIPIVSYSIYPLPKKQEKKELMPNTSKNIQKQYITIKNNQKQSKTSKQHKNIIKYTKPKPLTKLQNADSIHQAFCASNLVLAWVCLLQGPNKSTGRSCHQQARALCIHLKQHRL